MRFLMPHFLDENVAVLRRWAAITDEPLPEDWKQFRSQNLQRAAEIDARDPELALLLSGKAPASLKADALAGKLSHVAPDQEALKQEQLKQQLAEVRARVQSGEVVAERTNALAELHRELHADEPLVFGLVEAHEARLWLLCCDWVMEGDTGLDPKKTPMQKLERKAAELLDKCLRLNVNHPDQIEAEMKIRRGIWDGYRGGIVQDSRGRWFYGDGTPAIPQQGGGFKRQRSGLGGMFEGIDRDAIWSEIGRCFNKQREQSANTPPTGG